MAPNVGKPVFDILRGISNENLDFAGRNFDVVTLWDTADYLPEAIVEPVSSNAFMR